MSALTKQVKESSEIIPKAKLINGHYYIGKTSQRGLPIGIWLEEKNAFNCITMSFDVYYLQSMNHIEDDNGCVCFEPVKEIEL